MNKPITLLLFYCLLFYIQAFSREQAGSNRDGELKQVECPGQAALKADSIDGWVKFKLPCFVRDVTPEDNGSPHFWQYIYQDDYKKATISIMLNNSYKYTFNIKEQSFGRPDLKITYKNVKSDRYYLSGVLTSGRILYEFCIAKYGYGYTYTIEYDSSYSEYFKKYIPEILKEFKVLDRN
jgi:hypothetical protein